MGNDQDLRTGDNVSFDIIGVATSPYGYGKVTFASKSKVLIQPEHNLSVSMVMCNIKKVG